MTDRAKALLTLAAVLTCLMAFYVSVVLCPQWYSGTPKDDVSESILAEPILPPTITYELQLLSWNWRQTETGSYVEAKGQVKNISGRRLETVAAIVTFYDASGTFITYGRAFIEYCPIMPNQVSPFSIFERYNPAMKTATIEFQDWPLGGILSTKYP